MNTTTFGPKKLWRLLKGASLLLLAPTLASAQARYSLTQDVARGGNNSFVINLDMGASGWINTSAGISLTYAVVRIQSTDPNLQLVNPVAYNGYSSVLLPEATNSPARDLIAGGWKYFYIESNDSPPTTPFTANTVKPIMGFQVAGGTGRATMEIAPVGDANADQLIRNVSGVDASVVPGTYRNSDIVDGTDASTITDITSSPINNTPLPVNLLAFEAARNAGKVELKWTVAKEEALSQYTVERSGNGRSFETAIATVPATGLTAYTSTDAQPATGANYYRLKMVELSGAVKYSPIREVAFGAGASLATTAPVLFPNPAMLTTTLEYNAPEAFTATIQVYDLLGKLVTSQQADFHAGVNQHAIDVAGLATGDYLILLKGADQTHKIKFQKTN